MTGHLREQIIIYNNVKNLGQLSADRLQRTIDDFNKFTKHGGKMRADTRKDRMLDGEPTGWVSIDQSTEAAIKQDWLVEHGRVERGARGIPIGSRKVVDVNSRGKPIMRKGRRVLMTFRYKSVKGKPRWVTEKWKYVS